MTYDDEEKRITPALNQSGVFLQGHVMEELSKKGWKIVTEFPVTIAPLLDDPSTLDHSRQDDQGRIYAEEFPKAVLECQNRYELEETSIDVIGEKNGKETAFKLCIECKKLDPEYVDWIFIQPSTSNQSMNMITKTITSKGFAALLKVPKTTRYGNDIHVEISRFNWEPFKHLVTDFALAISDKKINRTTYRSKKTIVDEAVRQIIKGAYGLVLESVTSQVLSAEGYDHTINCFIPIVVTNANLIVCRYKSEDIDPKTGHITKSPSYEKTDSIIYECAPPKSVQFPLPLLSRQTEDAKKAVAKWHVLILSPKGLVELLKRLESTDLVDLTL